MADASDLKSDVRKGVPVRVRSPAPEDERAYEKPLIFSNEGKKKTYFRGESLELELKSYRGFIIKILFSLIIVMTLFLILNIISVACTL